MSNSFTSDDLDAAVHAGLLDPSLAERLRGFAAERARATASADDESFRLLTGFNDIFVTIGLALFLGPLTWLMTQFNPWIAAWVAAAAAWLLAEVFTRRRRMALPSIALLVVFVLAVFAGCAGAIRAIVGTAAGEGPGPIVGAGLLSVAAAAAHWRRFHVPITIAAGFAALAAAIVATVAYVHDSLLTNYPTAVILPLGLAAFALAMRFDMSDRERRTRRTDIAFWLHLIAAPAIVHPVVWNMLKATDMQAADALMVFALFFVLAVVALVVDRRALMVSSLSYLIYATGSLIARSHWNESAYALAALAVGAVVLLLSVAWRPLRARVIALMPAAIANAVPPAT